MASLKLYYQTNENQFILTADKCFSIDNIEGYLSQRLYISINDFQYIKPQLKIDIKVDLSQVYAEPLYNSGIKYVEIVENSKSYYYYVSKSEWRSKEAVRLSLIMDVLNTFKPNRDYITSNRSHINRIHKDRIKNYKQRRYTIQRPSQEGDIVLTHNSYVNMSYNGNIYPVYILSSTTSRTQTRVLFLTTDLELNIVDNQITLSFIEGENTLSFIDSEIALNSENTTRLSIIDFESEGINPQLYKEDNDKYVKDDNIDWYLIYKNQNEPSEELTNPVNCYLCTNENITISFSSNNTILPQMLEEGKYYYVRPRNLSGSVVNFSLKDNKDNNYQTEFYNGGQVPAYIKVIVMYRVGNNIYWALSIYTLNTPSVIYQTPFSICDFISVISPSGNDITVNTDSYLLTTYGFTDSAWDENHEVEVISLTSSTVEIKSISDIDRLDPKLIKIIKLPYSPINFEIIEGVYHIPVETFMYDIEERLLHLVNLSVKFNHNFVDDNISPLTILKSALNIGEISPNDNRSDTDEVKIYHSDFFLPKLVYDSFSFGFMLERVNLDKYYMNPSDYMNIKFTVSSTINSRFLFTYEDYICNELGGEDYNNIMPIARNNEITLYNSAYITYLKTGFNYDVKSKNRNIANSWISTGIGIASTIIGGLLSATGVGATFGVPLIIAGATTTAISVKNSVVNQIQQEQNFAEKITQLQNQGENVSGSDDVDLMSEYANNKLKWVIYKVSPIMNNLLLNLFYYTGYTCNIMNSVEGYINSRKHFNYIEADIVLKHTDININDEMLTELKNLYHSGITFIHEYNTNMWDIEQEKRNYEIILEGGE